MGSGYQPQVLMPTRQTPYWLSYPPSPVLRSTKRINYQQAHSYHSVAVTTVQLHNVIINQLTLCTHYTPASHCVAPSASCLCDGQPKVSCIKQYDSPFYGTSHNTAMAQVFNEWFIWFTVLAQGLGDVSGAGPSGCQSGSSTEHLLAADKKHACAYVSSPSRPENIFGGSS